MTGRTFERPQGETLTAVVATQGDRFRGGAR